MPAFEPATRGSHAEEEETELCQDDGKCLWSSLLKEVTHKASVKLPSTRALIVLGDDGCGKTTLITRLQGTEDPKTSYGLEYTFIDIKDEDRDDQTKLNVWILDGDVIHSHLLKFALNADNFGECVVVIMVSMAEPWSIVESLEKWADILSKHIKRLSIPPETLTDYKNGLVQQFREYVEPDSLLAAATPAPITHAPLPTAPTAVRRVTQALHPATAALLSSTLSAPPPANTADACKDEEDAEVEGNVASSMQLPLDATTLSENLGIPLVVVVTKTDAMKTLEKEDRFTEEHFDFIQMHIRRFCLTYGAALFYVSVKEDRNCDLLNRYLQSRIYGFPFTQTAYVVERDCVFVPTGWDSEKKIAILEENFAQIRSSDQYNDVIPRPPPRKPAVREPELVAQDEQSFLTRLIAIMQRDGNQPGAGGPTGSANAGTGANANSSEAILEQLATAAALTTGSAGPNQPSSGVPRASMGSPRTPQSGVRAKPSPGSAGSASVGSGGAGGGARTSEGVLANFFTSLLNKRSNVAGTPVVAPPTVSSNTDKMSPKDLQSELERLARSSREQLEANKHVKPANQEPEQAASPVPATAGDGDAAAVGEPTVPIAKSPAPTKNDTPEKDQKSSTPKPVEDNVSAKASPTAPQVAGEPPADSPPS